jgi:hypothetical protein
MIVAALFVEAGGCYTSLPNVDAWPIDRDARKYSGPHPVVAHPPCQRWGALGLASYARWGGEHNKPGNDQGCFESALKAVRTYGGVLEHPKSSRAWDVFALTKPSGIGWKQVNEREWVCEVWQSAYGHKARKATWLLYVGNTKPFELRWDRLRGSHQVGFQDRRGKSRNLPTLSRREANATPVAFRDELIQLATTPTNQGKQP